MTIAVIYCLEAIEVEIMERNQIFRAYGGRRPILKLLAEQKPVREAGKRVGSSQLRHIVTRGVMLDSRSIEMRDCLETEPVIAATIKASTRNISL